MPLKIGFPAPKKKFLLPLEEIFPTSRRNLIYMVIHSMFISYEHKFTSHEHKFISCEHKFISREHKFVGVEKENI